MPEKKILDIERSSAGSNTGISSRYLTQGETQHLFTLPMTLGFEKFQNTYLSMLSTYAGAKIARLGTSFPVDLIILGF